MTNPYTFTVMNPSEGYTLRINHHPDIDPADLSAFYQIGKIEVESGRPLLTIDLPLTTELPTTPIITIDRLLLSGSSSHIKAQMNTHIEADRMDLSNSTLESVVLMVPRVAINNSTLKNIEMEPGIMGQLNIEFSTFINGGFSYLLKGQKLGKFASLTLDEADIIGNDERRIYLESSFKNTTISFKHKNIWAESSETVQGIVFTDNDPVITLPYDSRINRGTMSYRLVRDMQGEPHMLVTYDRENIGAFYSLSTMERECAKGRYLALCGKNSFVFTSRDHDKTAFSRMHHAIALMELR